MAAQDGSMDKHTVRASYRSATVLFADMAGYTRLAEQIGEEETFHVMQEVHRELREAVEAVGGSVQDIRGDGLLAIFGAPTPIEDAPLVACRVALDINRRIEMLQQSRGSALGISLSFRTGIHTGSLVIGDIGDKENAAKKLVGASVNIAARIQELAESGTVLLSEPTFREVADRVECVAVGDVAIRGASSRLKVWRLIETLDTGRFDAAVKRGLTRFSGREVELRSLLSLWSTAQTGELQAVMITGEAGVGKSRLVYELRRAIGTNVTVMLGNGASARTSVPFGPVVDILKDVLRIPAGVKGDDLAATASQALTALGLSVNDTLPFLMSLMGLRRSDSDLDRLDAQILGHRTRDALRDLIYASSRQTPTLLVIEDIHWSDSATLELLESVRADERNRKLLVVVTSRPSSHSPWPRAPNAHRLALLPLPPERSKEVFDSLAVGNPRLASQMKRVLKRCEGNPYYIEELVSYVQSSIDGPTSAQGGRSRVGALPSTLESLLLERYSSLDEEAQRVLEVASAIGDRFTIELVEAVIGDDIDLSGSLQRLFQEALVERGSAGRMRFRHALVRDAVYGSILKSNSRRIHATLASAVSEGRGGISDDRDAFLAHHWVNSDRPGNAARHLKRLGEQCLRVYSLDEADQAFHQALELGESYPGCLDESDVADIVLFLARIYYFKFRFDDTNELIGRYMPRIEALRDARRLSGALFESGYAHVFAARDKQAQRELTQARKLGMEAGDDLAVAYAESGLMFHRAMWGAPGEARLKEQRSACERLKAVALSHGDVWLASRTLLALAVDHTFWGHPRESVEVVSELAALSRRMNDPRPQIMGLWSLAAAYIYDDKYQEAVEVADEALSLSLSPIDVLLSRVYGTLGRIASGQLTPSVDDLEAMLRNVDERGRGLKYSTAPWRLFASLGRLMQGDIAVGMTGLRQTLDWTRQTNQRGQEMLCHLVVGETYLAMLTSDQKGAFRLTPRNLLWIPRLVLFSRRVAGRELTIAVEGFRELQAPSHLARALHKLGLLDRHSRRPEIAMVRFNEAFGLAKSVGADVLAATIEKELSTA